VLRFQVSIVYTPFRSGSSPQLICYLLVDCKFQAQHTRVMFSLVFRSSCSAPSNPRVRIFGTEMANRDSEFPWNLVKHPNSMFSIEKMIKRLANESWSKTHTHTHLFSSPLTLRIFFYYRLAGQADFIYKFEKRKHFIPWVPRRRHYLAMNNELYLIQLGFFRTPIRKI
jgi:hypothetical protein